MLVLQDNWKELFRPHILERGLDYYETGAVGEITSTDDGFQAVVEGTKDYEVEIEIRDGEIQDMWCSCPYAEEGQNCKHMAAVLFEIEEKGYKGDAGGHSAAPGQAGLRESEEELAQVIRKIPEDEIRKLLLELAAEDESLQNRIMTQYTECVSERQLIRLKKEIENIAYRYSDRYEFVDWKNAFGYVCDMEEFLDNNVQKLIEKGYFMQAFELVNAVFIQVGNQDMDDSGGETEQLADVCYGYWKKILEHCGNEEIKKMFAWFSRNQSAGVVVDYMEEYIQDFLMNEFHDEDLLRQKLAMLDEEIEKAGSKTDCGKRWSAHYGYENNILKRLEIMEELHFPENEIQEYKKKNWRFAAIRKLQLSEYLEEGKLFEAIGVLKESKEMDKDSPGWVAEYSARLIELYQKLGMEKEYKDELIFQLFTFRQKDLGFVEKLKETCTGKEWEEYRERLLSEKNTWTIRYALLEKEGLYERLLEEIAASGSVSSINQYEKVLKERFPEQVRDIYVRYVKNQAEYTSDRKRYKELIQYLKKIKNYPGGDAAAAGIAREWRAGYGRRSAMMDELRKAGF